MPRVRVKMPAEPKVIEYPAELVAESTPVLKAAEQMASPTQTSKPIPVGASEPLPTAVAVPQTSEAHTPTKRSVTVSMRALAFAAVGCLLVLFTAAVFISRSNSNEMPQTLGATDATRSESEKYYEAVSKFVELPLNELPTVANVSDAEKVKKDNAVLADVRDGDKMLFFAKSRKVVVYRPSSNKVVAVVTLTPQQNTSPPPTTN